MDILPNDLSKVLYVEGTLQVPYSEERVHSMVSRLLLYSTCNYPVRSLMALGKGNNGSDNQIHWTRAAHVFSNTERIGLPNVAFTDKVALRNYTFGGETSQENTCIAYTRLIDQYFREFGNMISNELAYDFPYSGTAQIRMLGPEIKGGSYKLVQAMLSRSPNDSELFDMTLQNAIAIQPTSARNPYESPSSILTFRVKPDEESKIHNIGRYEASQLIKALAENTF